MLSITLFDLRYRARQFLIAVIGAALVFAIGLLNAGLSNSFAAEVNRFTAGIGADSWILPTGSGGPITPFASFRAADGATVRARRGVPRADPMITVPGETIPRGALATASTLMGFVRGGLGDLAPAFGGGA